MTKIQLISAPVDKGEVPLYEDGVFAPLGLIWLGNYLQEYNHHIDILDGQHQNLKSIESKLDAPIVGINFNIFSTRSLDKIAETAKEKGSTVVVGGQAATPLARELLTNSNIDYVVRYDGEEALRLLAEGFNPRQIPNLTYRYEDKVIDNPIHLMNLEKLPSINWSLKGIGIQKYWTKFEEVLKSVKTNHKHKKPLSSFTKKGCPMRQNDKGCSFCSRTDTTLRSKSPGQVHKEFQYLINQGADRIEEFSDSWLYDKKWLKEFVEIIDKEGHWGAPVRVYADTRHINPEVVELAQKIGIDSIILGIESGNEQILRQNGKPNTIKQILYSVELLGKGGVKASPSYVLGLIGESEETVEDTFRLAYQINNLCEIEMSYYSIMTPFPGSKAWKLLMTDSKMQRKHSGYRLNNQELQKDFINKFTQLGKEGVNYLSEKMEEKFQKEVAQRDY
ncbi:MAG: radical SAM protein [archaeon]